jgi:aminomethyltransferase
MTSAMASLDVLESRRAPLLFSALAGSLSVHALEAGDVISFRDPEGLQPATLILLVDPRVKEPLEGVADLERPAPAELPELVRAWLEGRDLGAAAMFSLPLFAGEQEAGAEVTLTASTSLTLLLTVPGGVMSPEAQGTHTDIEVSIRGLASRPGHAPPPLASPRLDIRIAAATAEAYVVKAGEYIQIIDVDGRQCSDFLAFDARALAEGSEYGLDPTTTRTLMGTANPGPGLHSKYFDERQRALVEIVRDTVGRHDTFMLACSAKYYADMGYPGHANCTDNFNAALAPHGVAARAGWPAINFFYNTFVRADDSIGLDEPWSRPGDYVLVRALTDLVCASSSCTDDIDPANAWQPTDIHVRVYPADCSFSPGIAHRMTPDSPPRLTRETGFHAATARLTRYFVDYRGYWLADRYASNGPIDEYWACRERAVLMDLSPLRKFEVTGPDAEALLQYAVTRNLRKLAVGQVVYTALCHDHGGMRDDGTVFRLGEHNFRLVCGDEYCGLWLREVAKAKGLKAWVRSSTDQLHNVALQGPRSREILAQVLETPPVQPSATELRWFRFTIGKIAGLPVLVSRTGYTGELGYEIWCHPSQAEGIWNAIWEAGMPHGLAPMGLKALDMVRIEAGLIFAGYEFCDQTDPFEAGIGFAVAADKTDDYAGAAALARRREHPARVLVGLDISGNEDIGHGDSVHIGRAQIGVVTSATRSPVLGKTIALARLDVSYGAIGTAVEIGKLDGQQKRIAATVVRFPHYDPEKTHVRA